MPVTTAMLQRYFDGVFGQVRHVGLEGSKGDICQDLQASVLIDDNAHPLRWLQGVAYLTYCGLVTIHGKTVA